MAQRKPKGQGTNPRDLVSSSSTTHLVLPLYFSSGFCGHFPKNKITYSMNVVYSRLSGHKIRGVVNSHKNTQHSLRGRVVFARLI